MEEIVCENCKHNFDESTYLPMTLPCSHPMCLNCINNYKPGEKFFCPKCNLDLSKVNLKELKPHQMILSIIQSQLNSKTSNQKSSDDQGQTSSYESQSASQTNTEEEPQQNNQVEYCTKHKEKEIEFFCQSCTVAVCSLCIFETHNGHHLTLLEDMSTIIKNNVKDFGKILKNLEKVNEDNQNNAESKLDDVDKHKQNQISIVMKSFEEIKKKIEEKKTSIIDEFNSKYFHEMKRFKKIQTCLTSNQTQIERIAHINEELTKNFEKFSDAKILKKIQDFTSFLHKSAVDIKRLYKTEISLKAELVIDPAMKPLPINITDLMQLLEKIDPKNICYPNEDDDEEETDPDLPNNQRPSFDNEINNYINRIGTEDKGDFDSNFGEKRRKIPKRSVNASTNISSTGVMQNNNSSLLLPNAKYITNGIINANYPIRDIKGQYRTNSTGRRMIQIPNNFATNGSSQRINGDGDSNSSSSVSRMKRYVQTANNQVSNVLTSHGSDLGKRFHLKNRIPSAGAFRRQNVELPPIINSPHDSPAVFCFGEGIYCMKFTLDEEKWSIIPYTNENSKMLGSLRFSSVCSMPNSKIFFTGGCKSSNDEPSNIAIEINTVDINSGIIIKKSMIMKRYGHSSVYLNGLVYVIGGYEHADRKETSMLSTLKTCERYDIAKNRWESIAPLNHPRAFCGCVVYKKSIFIFGGVYNNQLLSSIEKYDTFTNVWITYHIKLPEKLAKMGVVNYNDEVIILLGGIDEQYNAISTVRQGRFDNKSANNIWFKAPEMICARGVNSSAFYWEGSIYVLGGSTEGICEKFDFANKRWEMIDSYFSEMKKSKIEDVMLKYSCAMNYYIIDN